MSRLLVQLRHAPLPSLLRRLAVHCWFVLRDETAGRYDRWEVWQHPGAGGTYWGHVHRNLMEHDRGVGGGPAAVAAEWRGDAAERLRAVLERPLDYPHRERYRYWPGPNSNTYAAWVLARAGVAHDLDPRAIGRDYQGPLGAGVSLNSGGLRLESPVLGLVVGGPAGAELHVLGLTLGFTLRPPAVKTPLGRFPAPRRDE